MNLLFVGMYFPEPLLPTFMKHSKVGLDFAAHNLHKALFRGLHDNGIGFDIINYPHLGSFPPFYSTPRVPAYRNEDERVTSISYINISYIKRLDIRRKVKREILDWCKRTEGDKVVLLYNFEQLSLIPSIKKIYPDVRFCLLVTDLEEYMDTDTSLWTKVKHGISSFFPDKRETLYSYPDAYILLTEAMKQRIPVGGKPCLIMEGIYNDESDEAHDISNNSKKTILYTGNIASRYGILDLIDAFEKIDDPSYQLLIRGNGDTLDEIYRRSAADPRIKWLPQMSKQELCKLEREATLLVNPVSPTQKFTPYFFPSKTLEYLASGTPTLMHHLECIPKDYEEHILFFDGTDADSMAQRIREVCEMPAEERMAFGKKAKEFILANKTPKPQCRKIADFLADIHKHKPSKNFVFIGNLYPEGYAERLSRLGSWVDNAAQNLQCAVLEGLSYYYDPVTFITCPNITSFPKVRQLMFKSELCLNTNPHIGKLVFTGLINLPVIKLISKYLRVKKILRHQLRKDADNIVLMYGVHTPFILPIKSIKNEYNIKSCLIIPDLPEFMSDSTNPLYRMAKSIDARLIRKAINAIDCFVPLSRLMSERLPYADKPWVQVEGFYDNSISYPDAVKTTKRAILYTGKLDRKYGILELLEAFSLIKGDEYELWLRGTGNTMDEIRQRAAADSRIRIFPHMSKAELVALQKSATLLINPVYSTEEYTRYFFPSKTLEYMASGTPTLMCRLACLPEEYNDYVYFIDDESPRGIANRIEQICSQPQAELDDFGSRARQFILDNKNGKVQVGKIHQLITSVG